ncbi:DNA polymerase III subunit beta [Humidisolicoccus flavus]|uniref:DNA polymerase III subunit beta n=1 Tax=Humidisolicoccus flavus TaxID=3111414 RepID=UPI0032534E6C
MKFNINRDVFSDAVSFAVKLLPQRTTLPILTGVRIEANENSVTLSTFDYEVSARTSISAEVTEPGVILVSGRLLNDIANKLPQSVVVIEDDEASVKISCGSARFSLLKMPIEEYPTVPAVEGHTGLVRGSDFSEAIAQVAVAASREDVTPVITGVQLEASEQTLSFTATDRYRVSVRGIDWDSGNTSALSALVPARTIAEVGKTFGHAETIEITMSEPGDRQQIAFSAADKTVTSLLIKGNFPPVGRLFPASVEHYAVLNTADLVEATRRVQLVLEREAALRFTFSEGQVTLEAIGSEQAQANETLDCVLNGEEIVLSIKPQFLLDGLGATHSEFVRVSFTKTENTNKPGPMLITGQTSRDSTEPTDFKYLLQPNLLLR